MPQNKKDGAPVKRGNATRVDPNEPFVPKNILYSVTRHDRPAPNESNIPVPDDQNTILSKKFVDDNRLD